eukprot:GFYU01006133.1.p1 GENE.GFYU01006133.1~~GFYU01006133.1.p1  ORF type:complete len:126 (-),score=32.93 GFYU01006133.1:295-642(-)
MAKIKVNGEDCFLDSEHKLNVRGTFGSRLLLTDKDDSIIPLDDTGRTSLELTPAQEYFLRPKTEVVKDSNVDDDPEVQSLFHAVFDELQGIKESLKSLQGQKVSTTFFKKFVDGT